MLIRIYEHINIIFLKDKVIFKLTTPVIEERYLTLLIFCRLNKDLILYNSITLLVMNELTVTVNDL